MYLAWDSVESLDVVSRVKNTSLAESLAESHAYNPIRESRIELYARLPERLSPGLVFYAGV